LNGAIEAATTLAQNRHAIRITHPTESTEYSLPVITPDDYLDDRAEFLKPITFACRLTREQKSVVFVLRP